MAEHCLPEQSKELILNLSFTKAQLLVIGSGFQDSRFQLPIPVGDQRQRTARLPISFLNMENRDFSHTLFSFQI